MQGTNMMRMWCEGDHICIQLEEGHIACLTPRDLRELTEQIRNAVDRGDNPVIVNLSRWTRTH